MKFPNRSSVALIALAVLVSCVKEEKVILVSSVSLDHSELTVKEGEQVVISATVAPPDATDASLTWTSSDPSVASVYAGKVNALAKGKAVITATANDGSGRTASCNLTVKHSSPAVSLGPGQDKEVVIPTGGGSFKISFTTLENWTASLINSRADSWVEISPASGNAGWSEILVSVAENTGFDDRSASIRISCDDETETVVVTQKQKDAITLSSTRFDVESDGGNIVVKLKSNVDFSYRIANGCQSWIQALETKSYDDYSCSFSIAENMDILGRSGEIVFTDGTLSETVKVFQSGASPMIIISEHMYEVGSAGGQVRIDVASNVDVTMTIPGEADWLREIGTKAYSTNTFYIQVDPNPYPDDRSASISFSNNENGLSESVSINQKQLDQINVPDETVIVPESGGSFDITLEHNVEYSVSIDADWLKEVTTKSLSTATHSFAAEKLPEGLFGRTAHISFIDGKGSISRSVTILQRDASPIIQFQDEAVRAICVEKWDKNGDGELSEREAAAVTGLSRTFYNNATISSFKELAYFTGLNEINNSAFRGCAALESIVIPDNVRTIGYAAFYKCEALKDVIIPDSVTTLDEWAFSSCTSLKTINIPENVQGLGQYAFAYCRSLCRIECLPADPPRCGEYFLAGTKEGWIIVPEGSVRRYKEADGWKDYEERIITAKEEDSPVIVFKDQYTKAVCVEKWDRNGDGELSELEAASVKAINRDNAFKQIKYFDEFVYFTGLSSIPDYLFYDFSGLVSIKLPPSIKTIGQGAFYRCSGLKGELKLPEGLETIGADSFSRCSGLSGPLVLPESLMSLGVAAFANCSGLTGDLAIPARIVDIPQSVFYGCSRLNGTLTLHKDVKAIGDRAFYNTAFTRIDVLADDPPVYGSDAFNEKGCLIYVPKGKATMYQEADGWRRICVRITQEGHLPKDFFYRSSDYSADGEVVCLQKATKGKGITLIFLGDGYVDKDMGPGGKYEEAMRGWMEQFFVYEPYTTFREWFSVYTVKVVSPNSVFGSPDSERKLTRNIAEGDDSALYGNEIATYVDVCKEYAEKVPNSSGQPLRIAVFMNTEKSEGRSYCSFNSSGECTAFIFDAIENRPTTLNHELGGHGFAFLGDEYSEYQETFPDAQGTLEYYGRWDFYLNLDWRSDPSRVRWSHLLNDSRYANEGLGVFEGGNLYAYGIYRSTMNSMMRSDYRKGAVFNATSRELIYKNIMRWGSSNWTYDYESFVAADEAGRKQAAEAYEAYPPSKSPSVIRNESDEEGFLPGLPPIVTDEPVREIRVSIDGKVTLIR